MGNRPVKVATSKYQKQNAPTSYIPERQEILDAVQKSGGVINTRDLSRTFGLKGDGRKQLKTMLKSMIEIPNDQWIEKKKAIILNLVLLDLEQLQEYLKA